MLASLAEAASILKRNDYLAVATANASLLLHLMTYEGYLRDIYSNNQAKIEGYLEDYAMVIEVLLNLHQATFSGKWLNSAVFLQVVGGTLGTVPELLFERKQLIPALQGLLISCQRPAIKI